MPITQNSGELLRKQLEAEEEMWRLERESEQRAFAVKEKYEALRDFASDMSRGVSQTEAAAKALSRIALTQHIPKPMTEGEQSRLDLQRQKFEQSLIPKPQQPKIMSHGGGIVAVNPDLSVNQLVKPPGEKWQTDPEIRQRINRKTTIQKKLDELGNNSVDLEEKNLLLQEMQMLDADIATSKSKYGITGTVPQVNAPVSTVQPPTASITNAPAKSVKRFQYDPNSGKLIDPATGEPITF